MRDLILLRHAEAKQIGADGSDRERPLSASGEGEADAAGRWLATHNAQPQRILCSSARRAMMTAACVMAHIDKCTEQYEPAIYSATPGELISLLDTGSDDQVLLVGHNPGVEQLVALLTSGQSGDFRGVPPAGIAWIRVQGSLEPGTGTLHAFWSP